MLDNGNGNGNSAFTTNWIHHSGLVNAGPAEVYGVAIFTAFSIIFSGGPGPAPPPVSILEYYFMTFMLVVGSFVWAYVISSGCGILATLNPNGVHFHNMMDELNYFCREKQLPRAMTVKLREFLTQTAHVHRQNRFDVVLDTMSPRLKADAALCWAKETMQRVPYFRNGGIEDEFLASIALTLRPTVFCRTEYMPLEKLLIIERGIAAKNGRISTKGACLGDDMILNSMTFRDLDPAIALTFVVQVSALEKKDLESLLLDFPLARREIRRGSFKLAFCRAVVQVAKVIRHRREYGEDFTVLEAFVDLRKAKQRAALDQMRLKEPTKRVLANNIIDLSERTEAFAKEGESGRDALAAQLRGLEQRVDDRVGRLDAKLDAILNHLRVPVDPAPPPPRSGACKPLERQEHVA